VKIVVTIPTYNEIENIEKLVGEILAQDFGADRQVEVLVTDDHSPDGTWEAVAAMAASNPRVHLLDREPPRGRGLAGRDGFVWGLDHGADIVFEMDADFSHHPRYLPAMVDALAHADVVLGSRRVPGGEDVGRTGLRVGLTVASNIYVQLMLGLRVKDCNSGYRGWRRSALEAVNVAATFSPGPAIVHELLYKARIKKQRIVEIPIIFKDREVGDSTLTFSTLLRSYVTIFRLKWLGITGRLFSRPS